MSILADMSFVIDAALLVALCICVFFLVRTSNAVGTLRKAQEGNTDAGSRSSSRPSRKSDLRCRGRSTTSPGR